MGNQLTAPGRALPPAEVLADLGSVTYKDSLGGGRLFKSALCVHDDGGLVVVKVYAKRGGGEPLDVRPYKERLLDVRSRLAGLPYPHAWPAQRIYESDRAVFLVRQYLAANLAQRISTRPFLTLIEKRWIAYQLLLALAQCHAAGICHGDIRAENVALTSWDWAFLVDFAPYKPTLLPADNPADFSFFFDTGGRRKCCIAPERFYDPGPGGPSPAQAAAAPLTPAMDVFSLGCVLAELFLDGQPLFDYSRLLAYRLGGAVGTAGAAGPASLAALDKVHPSVRGMIAHMVQRDPSARHSVQQYLQEASGGALPPFLATTIHPFFASMLALDTDGRVALVQQEYGEVKRQLLAGQLQAAADASSGDGKGSAAAAAAGAGLGGEAAASPAGSRRGSQADEAAQREAEEPGAGGRVPLQQAVSGLLGEAQASLKQLEGRSGTGSRAGSRDGTPQPTPRGSSQAEQPSGVVAAAAAAAAAVQAAGQPSGMAAAQERAQPPAAAEAQRPRQQAAQQAQQAQHEGMVLVAVLLCTLLRGCRLQGHKTRVVSLLRDSATYCDDETRLQRVLPYLVAATAEPLAAVKVVALRAIARVLAQVRGVPPSEAKVFNEYVLPSLSLLPSEAELAVQVEYAACIAQLASTAQAFLEQLQRRRLQHAAAAAAGPLGGGGGSGGSSAGGSAILLNYDEEMGHLRAGVERVVHDLLVGPHPETKLALLPHLGRLAAFAGRRDTADVLLPSLLTFFNSQSWQVRAAFYASFAGVCPSLGPEGVAAIVLPFLDRLVGDPNPAVVAEAVAFLAAVCSAGLLRKRHVLQVAGRLCCRQVLGAAGPTPVRAAAVDFLAAAGRQLSAADVQALLLPLALPHLAAEPLSFEDPDQIARALKDDSASAPSGGDGSRVPRRRGVQPMRPGYPPVPPAVPPLPQRSSSAAEGAAAAGGRLSLDLTVPPGGPRGPAGSASMLLGGAAGGSPAAAAAAAQGSRSVLLPPPNASTYSLQVDPRFLHHGSSYLSAALEQSMMAQAGAGGHLVASTGSAGPPGRRGRGCGGRLHMSAHWGPADSGMQLVARARRTLPQPASIAHQMRMQPAVAQRGAEPSSAAPGGAPAAGLPSSGVRGAMSAALAAGLPGGGAGDAASQHVSPWYPRGVLVAHLAEHKKAVNRLAVAGCGAFFASASSDETVKVWDCRRLETDISFRSRLTYTAQAGRITALAACQDGQTMASGSSAGSIHVWRVEYAARAGGAPERYTGILSSRQVSPDGSAVLDLAAWGPSLLVYTTQQGGLAAWDVRLGRDAWSLPYCPAQGALERLVLDPASQNWLLGGTSRGHLCLWDARFRLPVNSWQHPGGAGISALALAAAPPQRLGLGLGAAGAGGGPLLYVAAGDQEVGLWDIAEAKCQQVLRVLRPGASDAARRQVPASLSPPQAGLLPPRGLDMMSRARQLAISELQAPATRRREGCRALLPTPGGQLLAGGADRTVRCWDSGRPAHSYVVCAPPPPIPAPAPAGSAGSGPAEPALVDAAGAPIATAEAGSQATPVDVPAYSYAARSIAGVPVLEESCTLQRSSSAAASSAAEREAHLARMAWAERAAALCHALAVTDLARVEAQSGEPLLLSAGADGVIKAWR
ncbi:hypothetical protein ABPG75_008166 [Micractinium tetrahymenae]